MDNPLAQSAPIGRFARWAANALLLFVLIGAIVAVMALLIGAGTLAPALIVAAAGSIGSLVAIMRGLQSRRDWATPAAIVVLWLIVGQGVLETIVQLTENTIHIPIGAIVALIVLLGAPAPPPTLPDTPSSRQVLTAVLVIYLASWIVPAVTTLP